MIAALPCRVQNAAYRSTWLFVIIGWLVLPAQNARQVSGLFASQAYPVVSLATLSP